MGKKLTIEFIKEQFEKENYILLSTIYVNSREKINFICPNGHQYTICWDSWRSGCRCSICSKNVFQYSFEYIKQKFKDENYTLLSSCYTNATTKLKYICPNGHEHSVNWNHWKIGNRCVHCTGNIKHTYEYVKQSFIAENYTLLSTKYNNLSTKLYYRCPNNHVHYITFNNWNKNRRCPTCYKNNNKEQNSSYWKGGITKRNLALYDTYNNRLSYCEETRRDPKEEAILQVKCTKCNTWFTPTRDSVQHRIYTLEKKSSNTAQEANFYCSDECKDACPIFKKQKYSADEKRSKTNSNFTSAELNAWSKEVLKRANNQCEYCGGPATEAHHIYPKKLEPFYALDPDNGVACCEECHYKHGHKDWCSTGNLANIICD